MQIVANIALFFMAFVGMEGVAWFTHRYVMHGPLWMLHRSHHEHRKGLFEANDLFVLTFATPSILLIWLGVFAVHPALWLGLGMAGYGAVYALFHDGVVHRRFPVPFRIPWLKHLVQAHRLHHATSDKDGAVSFGFLRAPPVRELKQRLKQRSCLP